MKNTGKLAKTKKIFLRLMIITFLVLIFWWLYGMYAKIEVYSYKEEEILFLLE